MIKRLISAILFLVAFSVLGALFMAISHQERPDPDDEPIQIDPP